MPLLKMPRIGRASEYSSFVVFSFVFASWGERQVDGQENAAKVYMRVCTTLAPTASRYRRAPFTASPPLLCFIVLIQWRRPVNSLTHQNRQCSKRKIPCEYPVVSRRGQRNLDGKKKAQPEEQYAPSRLTIQESAPGYGYGYGN